MSSKYLLEIGVEELPANQVDDALNQLKNLFEKYLTEEKVEFGEFEMLATPRRLTIIAKDLSIQTDDIVEEVKGPAVKSAYNKDGSPSKALLGFIASKNITESDIYTQSVKDVEYIYAKITKKMKTIDEILKEIVGKAIRGITFSKSMRWGGKNLRFSRPIRWIVSLLDNKILKFDFEGIKVSNETYGHRFLSHGVIIIDNIDEYKNILKDAYVIVDQNERKDIIKYGASKLAKEKGGNVKKDLSLLDEVTYLVEYPTPLIGRIKEHYMELPDEVIVTPMREHLRFFPVIDDDGKLMPYFITVRNGNSEHLDVVTHGNEMVLDPRLEDAKFFFEEDRKNPLSDYLEKLKTVVFNEKLGTLYDKTERMKFLAKKYSEYLSVGEETTNNTVRAAELSKADLVTKLVCEFTELQGKMGKIYAELSGENEVVSCAIFEQYLPRFSGDVLPSTTSGTVLSLTDKFDTICGMFAVGIRPTGSEDPFALRRAALGIINIILDKKINIKLEDFISDALYTYVEKDGLVFDYNEVKGAIIDFLKGRLKNILIEEGYRYDIVDSTINTSDSIVDVYDKTTYINENADSIDFKDALEAYTRIANLAEKADDSLIDEKVLKSPDIAMLKSFKEISAKYIENETGKHYEDSVKLLAKLKEPINKYMDDVMIMVEDEELKLSRLALLREMKSSFSSFCDFSKIIS